MRTATTPDHVRDTDHTMDEGRLERLYGAPVGGGTTLGEVPLGRFTLDHAQAAMTALEKLPASKFARQVKRAATRRQYAQVINRVLALAVWPLRIIEANPLPRGFLPKVGKPPAYAYLYPAEDAALMACVGDDEGRACRSRIGSCTASSTARGAVQGKPSRSAGRTWI